MKLFPLIWQIQRSSMMDFPRNLSFLFRSFVSREPNFGWLYQPYIIWDKMKRKAKNLDPNERIICPQTQFVIDGFQGSANSFATEAFKLCQTKKILLANHLHSPAQIIEATKKKIPILLTVRDPEGAIASLISRWPHISVNYALRSYIAFYKKLQPYSNHFVVSDFPQTIKHLDQIMTRVNSKFQTDFDIIDVNRANVECHSKFNDDPQTLEQKKIIKQRVREALMQRENIVLLKQAQKIHESYVTISQL